MRDFFHGWRRKANITILVFALIVLGRWMRFERRPGQFGFHAGDAYWSIGLLVDSIVLLQLTSVETSRLEPDSTKWNHATFRELAPLTAERSLSGITSANEAQIQWQHRYMGFEVGQRTYAGSSGAIQVIIRKTPLWSVVLPPTLFFAYLLRRKPRTPKSSEKPAGISAPR